MIRAILLFLDFFFFKQEQAEKIQDLQDQLAKVKTERDSAIRTAKSLRFYFRVVSVVCLVCLLLTITTFNENS